MRFSLNPTASLANALAERTWRFGAEAVIAIGGRSVIDVAKIAAVIVKVEEKVKHALPLFAINLTHGTGTEIYRYAIATNNRGNKGENRCLKTLP